MKHTCVNKQIRYSRVRRKPDQLLRYLHDKEGRLSLGGRLFDSPDCSCEWTSDDFSTDYAFEKVSESKPWIMKVLNEVEQKDEEFQQKRSISGNYWEGRFQVVLQLQ